MSCGLWERKRRSGAWPCSCRAVWLGTSCCASLDFRVLELRGHVPLCEGERRQERADGSSEDWGLQKGDEAGPIPASTVGAPDPTERLSCAPSQTPLEIQAFGAAVVFRVTPAGSAAPQGCLPAAASDTEAASVSWLPGGCHKGIDSWSVSPWLLNAPARR